MRANFAFMAACWARKGVPLEPCLVLLLLLLLLLLVLLLPVTLPPEVGVLLTLTLRSSSWLPRSYWAA